MRPDSQALIWDAALSREAIVQYITGRTQQDYDNDRMFRRAVEREFQITGEALAQLRRTDPAVDDSTVWEVATTRAPILLSRLDAIAENLGNTT